MQLPPDLLDHPVGESARLIALGFLDQAADAYRRLVTDEDPQALDDFRAALHGLRSTLRAYRPHLEHSIRPKLRRRLRKLIAATGDGRLLGRKWRRLHRKLRKRLTAEPRQERSFAAELSGLIAEHADTLQEQAHRVLFAERLRYLLEPITGQVEGVPEVIGLLEDESAGRTDELLAGLRGISGQLAGRARDNLEIERKYLLDGLPGAVQGVTALEVDQGWLPGERLAERLRRVHSEGEERFYRTVKARGETPLSRLEIEEETTRELFDYLWPLTEGRRVRKRRYRVPEGTLTWEIDEFLDRPLVLAEVELPSEDTVVAPPDWLGPYLVREVTGEGEYLNLNLAR